MNPMIYDDYKKKFLYTQYGNLNNNPKGPSAREPENFIIVKCKRTFKTNKVNECCNLFNQHKEEFMKKGINLNKIIKIENCN